MRKMGKIIGNAGVFDHNVQEYDVFCGRLTQFIYLNNILNNSVTAVLLFIG